MIDNYLFLCFFIVLSYFIVGNNGEIEFPYLVSVQSHNKRHRIQHICGGTIIDAKSILTAANCVVSNNNRIRGDFLSIVTGIHGCRSANGPADVIGEVKTIYQLKKYKPPKFNNYADIVVLRLNNSLKLSSPSSLRALELPKNNNEAYGGKTVDITSFGWNWIERGDLINLNQCQQNFPKHNFSNDNLCVRVSQSHNGTRYADIGSPLIHGGILIGVLSRIPDKSSEKILAAMYTKVAEHSVFIKNSMEGNPSRYMQQKMLF